jgi:hypothetical protein
MKKFILTCAMIACSLVATAQKPLSFTTIIQADGVSAQTLYDLTKSWFVKTYIDSRSVLKNENPGKELTGTGSLVMDVGMMYLSIKGYINYLIDVQFKDGRLKFTMNDFRHKPDHEALFNNNMGILVDSLPKDLKTIGIEGVTRKSCYKYFFKNGTPLCEKQFKRLSESLKAFIEKREDTKDDW